ncbi:MAG TPA: hypothetical protein VI911_12075 [Patescibacteria group bacterium]|nr:hypothetical protein [Patescibacteria group bacterium]
MSKISLNDDGTATFYINVVGENSKETYLGTFTVKCFLSPLEFVKADKLYRDLLGPDLQNAHSVARSTSFAFAQLQQRVIKCPPFWENKEIGGGHIKDNNVLSEVLELSFMAQDEFVKSKEREVEDMQKSLTDSIRNGKIAKEDTGDE